MEKRNPFLKKAGKTALIAFTLSALVYSCKKIEEKSLSAAQASKTPGLTKSDGGYDVNLSDEEVHNKIHALTAVIWNNIPDQWNTVKPTNAIDAMDYMEGVLNYTHGNAWSDLEQMETYHQNFTIPVGADGVYHLNDYIAAFNVMSDYIVGIYNANTSPDKTVIAIDLKQTPVANEVDLEVFLGSTYMPDNYSLKSFGSPGDYYKYDRVSGPCLSGGAGDAACVKLEEYGRWNMNWYKTMGGTVSNTLGYYSKVGSDILDIRKVPLLTGSSIPPSFTPDFLNYQIFANDTWRGMTGMPCINSAQMNFYLDNIRPLFTNLVSGLTTREFIDITVNPKYQSGGSYTNPLGWGDPNNPGLNNTGPYPSGSVVVTPASQNTAGKNTYYEHYYILGYGRHVNVTSLGTFRKL